MRSAWCFVCTGWLYTWGLCSGVSASSSKPPNAEAAAAVSSAGLKGAAGDAPAAPIDPAGSAEEPTAAVAAHHFGISPYKYLDRMAREGTEPSENSSDEWGGDEASASEDGWSSVNEMEEDVLTEGERLCSPSKFLLPLLHGGRPIRDAGCLLETFEAFRRQNQSSSKKLLFFMTAGTGEEVVGNRQISQRLGIHPTLRKQRSGFLNPSEGVAELSDDGRQQVDVLRRLLQRFAAVLRGLSPEQRSEACIDSFFVSALQSGIETSLEVFSGLLETLACQQEQRSSSSLQLQQESFSCSRVRLLVVPHLREVVEAEADVGETLSVVLKKTKPVRVNAGHQRDIFDCAVATFGLRWRKAQLGAAGDSKAFEEDLALLLKAASEGQGLDAALQLLQSLDKFAFPKGVHCLGDRSSTNTTVSFLREAAKQETLTQKAVWAAPEEMQLEAIETEASITRRGLSLLRIVCSLKASKFMLVSHPKFVERLSEISADNGELRAFAVDCQALAKCLLGAGLRPW